MHCGLLLPAFKDGCSADGQTFGGEHSRANRARKNGFTVLLSLHDGVVLVRPMRLCPIYTPGIYLLIVHKYFRYLRVRQACVRGTLCVCMYKGDVDLPWLPSAYANNVSVFVSGSCTAICRKAIFMTDSPCKDSAVYNETTSLNSTTGP